jgi:hypothetical protein
MKYFYVSHNERSESGAFFSAALDLPNGRQAFASFYQEKDEKPAVGDREKSIKNISTIN